MSRAFDERSNGLIIGAVIAAGITSLMLLGNYTYFGVTPRRSRHRHRLGGGAGLRRGRRAARRRVQPHPGRSGRGLPGRLGRCDPAAPRPVRTFSAGFVVAVCGLASGNTVFGTGYAAGHALIDHGVPLPLDFGPLKLAATAASSSPAFRRICSRPRSRSAPASATMSRAFPRPRRWRRSFCWAWSGYFSGVVQAPITAFAIVAEMTADHNMIVPLMASSLIGSATSSFFTPRRGLSHPVAQLHSHVRPGRGDARARRSDRGHAHRRGTRGRLSAAPQVRAFNARYSTRCSPDCSYSRRLFVSPWA